MRAAPCPLAMTFVLLSLAGCQTMTSARALEESRKLKEELTAQLQAQEARWQVEQKQNEDARRRGDRQEQRYKAAQLINGGDFQGALEVVDAVFNPPLEPRTDPKTQKKELVDVKVALDPVEEAEFLVLQGTAFFNLPGHEKEALGAFQEAVSRDLRNRAARRNLGKLLFTGHRYVEALEAWRGELEDGYRDADLLYLIAQARYEIGLRDGVAGEIEAARAAMEDVLVERPRDIEVRRYLATLDYETGRYADAASLLEGLRQENPLDADILEQLGNAYLGLRDAEKALDLLELSARLKPPGPESCRTLGELCAGQGFPARAAEWYARASAGDPKRAPAEERARVGSLYLAGGRLEEAAAWLSAVGERDPSFGEAQSALVRLYRELGKPDQALSAFGAARRLRARAGAAHLAAARIQPERRQYAKAAEIFSRLSALPGFEADGFAGLAEAARGAGDLHAAQAYYRRALEARPGDAVLRAGMRRTEEELLLGRETETAPAPSRETGG